jgi:predicted dehydrogenase
MATRIGFVGTGNIAQIHLQRLQGLADAEVVALCDVDASRAEEARQTCGGTVYSDHHDMLEQERLDALYVCVPPYAHLDQELEAIARGIHLYVEGPVVLDVELGRRIEREAQQNGVIAASGYQWRYLDTMDRLRSLVEEEPIGLAMGRWLGGIPDVPWWRNRYQSGGQLIEQASQMVDLARYLLGEVTEVGAYASSGLMDDIPGYNLDDASVVVLRFESGAVGTIASSCLLTGGGGTIELTLLGRDLRADCGASRLRIERSGQAQEFTPQVDPYLRASQAFLEAVSTGDPAGIRSAYGDGLKTVQVVLAANHAMQTGQIIKL